MSDNKEFVLKCASKTDIGMKRSNNEDAIYHNIVKSHPFIKGLITVADGVGGNSSGEIASNDSIKILSSFFTNSAKKYDKFCDENSLNPKDISQNLKQIFFQINNEIFNRGNEDDSGMATTLTCCIITSSKLHYAHLGDSRLYIIRNKNLEQITLDDSEAAESLRENRITLEEFNSMKKNKITQAIGMSKDIIVQTGKREIELNDILLVCSDGLHGMLSDKEIIKLASKNPEIAVEKLIAKANENGGKDNVSVAIAKIADPNIMDEEILDTITSSKSTINSNELDREKAFSKNNILIKRAEKNAREKEKQKKIIFIGIASVFLIFILFIVFGGKKEEPVEKEKTHNEANKVSPTPKSSSAFDHVEVVQSKPNPPVYIPPSPVVHTTSHPVVTNNNSTNKLSKKEVKNNNENSKSPKVYPNNMPKKEGKITKDTLNSLENKGKDTLNSLENKGKDTLNSLENNTK